MSLKLLHEPETEDPILSVVNLIDIFLVIIAALLITVAQNPLINPFNKQDVTVITDPGKPTMEVTIKKGEKIEHYKAIPSLRHVLLVESTSRRVEHHHRPEGGAWTITPLTDGAIRLDDLGGSIPLDDVYLPEDP